MNDCVVIKVFAFLSGALFGGGLIAIIAIHRYKDCYSARKQGRNGNCWREAKQFERAIEVMPFQRPLLLAAA